ncbi:ABC-2 type transport system ATP-binding protein [Microcella alkaliphila]|uniref:ABC-2 type transport system ATP-binding protein n=1 Tax=Microcella alkaliphila TaxID=279828 RepID=A0A4Q7TNA8_9MICO|nr:ATP-binding cassette domain-containing protein [Microcella alkaliphila]RZT62326.1 ABC-2 type transport system ATP-binding protein [Microcella alkaliphila]
MPTGTPITIDHLTKRYGAVAAVDDVSFTAHPGRVTGFLGPNGAGKTTTLRVLLGLARATSGTATFGGTAYAALDDPARRVGASLSSDVFHPGRSGRDHLRVLQLAAGLERDRIDAVLQRVGMTDAADRRVGGYSLGMRQRLGLAAALLGDPGTLVLDEPINGLDPAGITWIRVFLRELAAEGRTILLSSHVLSEVSQTVDDVVVIARGRIVMAGALAELSAGAVARVRVDAADRSALASAIAAAGGVVETPTAGPLVVTGLDADGVGRAALAAAIPLTLLTPLSDDLESVFLRLTSEHPDPDARPASSAEVAA